jgi:hypothetical protein
VRRPGLAHEQCGGEVGGAIWQRGAATSSGDDCHGAELGVGGCRGQGQPSLEVERGRGGQ